MLRNLSWLTVANLLAKPPWYVFLTAVCMRVLGVQDYGVFAAALALATMFAILSDVGTYEFTIREVARRRSEGSLFFSSLGVGRAVLAVLVGAVTVSVALGLGYGGSELIAVVFASVYAVSLRLAEFSRAFFRAYERLDYEAVSIVVEKVVVIASGTVFLLAYRTPEAALLGIALGMMATLTINALVVHLRFSSFRLDRFDGAFLRRSLLASLPIGLFLVFSTALLQVGIVLLKVFADPAAAANFAAPQRLLEGLSILPGIAAAALLPRLSALHHLADRHGFATTFLRGAAILLAISTVVAVVLWLFAPLVISLLSDDPGFERAATVLGLLAWAFPVMCLKFLGAITLIASDEQRFLAGAMAVGAVVMVAGSMLVIPFFAETGVAVVFGGCYLLVGGLAFWRLRWAFGSLRGRAPVSGVERANV